MTEPNWNIIKTAVSKLDTSPSWLSHLAQRSFAEINALPKLDYTSVDETAWPVITEKPVASDYLQFLDEQIRLNARGNEWTNVLQKRLNALQPFVGKMVVTAQFFRKPNSVTLAVDVATGQIIYVEYS